MNVGKTPNVDGVVVLRSLGALMPQTTELKVDWTRHEGIR